MTQDWELDEEENAFFWSLIEPSLTQYKAQRLQNSSNSFSSEHSENTFHSTPKLKHSNRKSQLQKTPELKKTQDQLSLNLPISSPIHSSLQDKEIFDDLEKTPKPISISVQENINTPKLSLKQSEFEEKTPKIEKRKHLSFEETPKLFRKSLEPLKTPRIPELSSVLSFKTPIETPKAQFPHLSPSSVNNISSSLPNFQIHQTPTIQAKFSSQIQQETPMEKKEWWRSEMETPGHEMIKKEFSSSTDSLTTMLERIRKRSRENSPASALKKRSMSPESDSTIKAFPVEKEETKPFPDPEPIPSAEIIEKKMSQEEDEDFNFMKIDLDIFSTYPSQNKPPTNEKSQTIHEDWNDFEELEGMDLNDFFDPTQKKTETKFVEEFEEDFEMDVELLEEAVHQATQHQSMGLHSVQEEKKDPFAGYFQSQFPSQILDHDVFEGDDINKEETINESDITTGFTGFQSAGGKKLKSPSKEAKEKAAMLFNDIDKENEEIFNAPNVTTSFTGFQSAGGKKLKSPSKEAKAKAALLFHDIEKNEELYTEPIFSNTSTGFKSAGGKKLKSPSKEAKEKAALLFNDIDKEGSLQFSNIGNEENIHENKVSTSFSGFQSAGGKKLKSPSKEAKAKAATLFNDDELFTEPVTSNSFIGFQSAGGKKLKSPSKEAKEKAALLFEKIEKENKTFTEPMPIASSFTGFQSAGGKKLKSPSKEAKEKAALLFTDIEKNDSLLTPMNENKNLSVNGFQSASGKKLSSPSKESKEKAAALFSEIEKENIQSTPQVNFQSASGKKLKSPTKEAKMKALQLFSESETKEIPQQPPQKVFSTPLQPLKKNLLQHSKTKKRFSTPFKTPNQPPLSTYRRHSYQLQPSQSFSSRQTAIFKHNEEKEKERLNTIYMKLKKMNRIPLQSLELNLITPDQVDEYQIPQSLLEMTYEELQQNILEIPFVKYIFESFRQQHSLNEKWIMNHLQLILWKFISQLKYFPHILLVKGIDFYQQLKTYLEQQLQYRYEREYILTHRSVFKKCLEGDENLKKFPLVILITAIHYKNEEVELEVSDGWYFLRCKLDLILQRAVKNKKIFIGQKLLISNCQLLPSGSEPCAPLEQGHDSKYIQLNANCCKKALWHQKLGFQFYNQMTLKISNILPEGGLVCGVYCEIVEQLGVKYLEVLPSGQSVVLNAQEEEKAKLMHEKMFQMEIEKCFEEIKREMDESKMPSTRKTISIPNSNHVSINLDLQMITSGAILLQIYKDLKAIGKEEDFYMKLNQHQKQILKDVLEISHLEERLKLQEDVLKRVQKTFGQRQVTPFIELLIKDISGSSKVAILSIWKPKEEIIEKLKKEKKVLVTALSVKMVKEQLRLSTTSFSQFHFQKQK